MWGLRACCLPLVVCGTQIQANGSENMKEQHTLLKHADVMPKNVKDLLACVESQGHPEAPDPQGLNVQLRKYQRQSLGFMLAQERAEGGVRDLIWGEIKTPTGGFWYSPLLERAALSVPRTSRGGFLAEDMGLGKTVEVLALVLANPAPATLPSLIRGLIPTRATLVICAVSLVGQWIEEAKGKLKAPLRIHMFHGTNRIRDPQRLATEFDLVVTTYSTAGSDFNAKPRQGAPASTPPLSQIHWHRIVLDESHTIKNPAVSHSKACHALSSNLRWCCTGTPINNGLEDLHGQLMFLNIQPFSNKAVFDKFIRPCFSHQRYNIPGSTSPVAYLLKRCMIRHTKTQQMEGETILQLPPKVEENVPVQFTAEERAVYNRVYRTAHTEFARYQNMGPAVVNSKVLQIMSNPRLRPFCSPLPPLHAPPSCEAELPCTLADRLLLPMRRLCSGGSLKKADLEMKQAEDKQAEGTEAPNPKLVCPVENECPICLEAPEQPTLTPCSHWFCMACITEMIGDQASALCPICRRVVQRQKLQRGVAAAAPVEERQAEEPGASAAQEGGSTSESKLKVLLEMLARMRSENADSKALVFSQ
ncbi:hypothetical protein CYMTET_27027, partial [Cymbomonas tetramitiformis]